LRSVLAGNRHRPKGTNVIYLGVVAGAAGVVAAGVVAAALRLAFFFDFFFVVAFMALPLSLAAGALVGAGVCANEIPATASESVRPRMADVSFFMMF
jgi:hypothetical protein